MFILIEKAHNFLYYVVITKRIKKNLKYMLHVYNVYIDL